MLWIGEGKTRREKNSRRAASHYITGQEIYSEVRPTVRVEQILKAPLTRSSQAFHIRSHLSLVIL